MPNTLVRKGLQKAINEFIENNRNTYGLEIRFICEQELHLNQHKEVNIYRIIQEILHNTIKHAQASLLIIKIVTEGDRLLLMTADNGKGFDYFAKVKDNPGLGLRNLQSRTEVMGGRKDYRSSQDCPAPALAFVQPRLLKQPGNERQE